MYVCQSQSLIAWPKVLAQRMKLPGCNLVALEAGCCGVNARMSSTKALAAAGGTSNCFRGMA